MAKSSRSSAKKINNQRKAATVFGPVETARQERLSAKLLELAKQPKATSTDAAMDVIGDSTGQKNNDDQATDETAMKVDSPATTSKASIGRKRIDKRRQKKSKVTFTKYSDRSAAKRKGSAK